MMAQTAMRIMWRIDVVLERPIGREGIGYQRCHKTPPTPKTIMRRFQRRQRTEFLNGRVAFHRRFCREPEMEFPVAKSDTPLFRTAAIAVLLRPSPLPIAAGRLRQIPNGMSAARVRLRKQVVWHGSTWPGRTVRVRLVRDGRLRLETRSEQHKFRPQRHCTPSSLSDVKFLLLWLSVLDAALLRFKAFDGSDDDLGGELCRHVILQRSCIYVSSFPRP